jgi:fibronectin type 3 domain-containing protein
MYETQAGAGFTWYRGLLHHIRRVARGGTWLAVAFAASSALAQAASPCPAPTPGAPHVCLTWTASTTAGVTYNVYRATVTKGENYSTPLASVPVGQLFYYDASVAVGTQYFYTITAALGGALSAPTSEVSAQIPVPPGSPGSPAANID